ncbi:MAG: hypothetical protein HY719_06845 [Planctomycetes bacterium]|nr:hypothetical protein [Planctomycetota bacterium]
MKAEAIRIVFRTTPYRPLEIVMNNGNHHYCPSPEIFVSDIWVVLSDEFGGPLILDTDAIVEIRVSRARKGRAPKVAK